MLGVARLIAHRLCGPTGVLHQQQAQQCASSTGDTREARDNRSEPRVVDTSKRRDSQFVSNPTLQDASMPRPLAPCRVPRCQWIRHLRDFMPRPARGAVVPDGRTVGNEQAQANELMTATRGPLPHRNTHAET